MSTLSSQEPRRTSWLLGVGMVLLSSIAFSAKAVMAKLAYRHGVDALTVLALRMAFALPFYVAVLAVRARREARPLTRRELWLLLGLGLLGYYLASLFDFLGLEHISAGLERLILFTYPTLVVLFELALFKKRLTRVQLLALVVTYVGIAVVFQSEIAHAGDNVPLGAALVFAGAVTYAGYLVGGGQLIPRIGAERFTAWALTISSVAVLAHALLSGRTLLGLPGPVYELGLWLALVATVLPTFLLAEGIRRIGPGPAAITGTLGPVSTIALAHVFLGEPILVLQVAGAALVLAGATLVALGRPSRLEPHQTTVTR
ncbi:MAG TPA: DMT family transporter [Polyangiaceae bacterium]|nr:DMT family transporter [Polyangiaceae bacterium]